MFARLSIESGKILFQPKSIGKKRPYLRLKPGSEWRMRVQPDLNMVIGRTYDAVNQCSIVEPKEARELLEILIDAEWKKGTPAVTIDGSPKIEMRRNSD